MHSLKIISKVSYIYKFVSKSPVSKFGAYSRVIVTKNSEMFPGDPNKMNSTSKFPS